MFSSKPAIVLLECIATINREITVKKISYSMSYEMTPDFQFLPLVPC